jgi:hypothetical protein
MTLAAALLRLVKPFPNFAPVGGLALFAGARLNSWHAFAVPLAAMAASDVALYLLYRNEPFNPFVYASFVGYVLLGRLLLRHETAAWKIGLVTVAGSVQFFLVTNFGHWLTTTMYPHTWDGLLTCYLAALPFYNFDRQLLFGFFGNTLASDLLFAGVLFAAHAWLARRWFPAEQPAAEVRS